MFSNPTKLQRLNSSSNPRVVIVGAGFAGVEAAKILGKSNVEVVLIDRNTYHTFIPMLYQVATAVIDPQHVVYPLRRMFRGRGSVKILQAEVTAIDFDRQSVQTSEGLTLDYQYLILATGSQSQYLGVSGAPQHSWPMRSLPEAIAIRHQILSCFEQAVKTTDIELRRKLLRFVIVGGGPTGVELAGALSELIQTALKRDYPTLKQSETQVVLVQSSDRLLKGYPQRLGDYTARWLRRHQVEVYLGTRVSQVTAETVELEDQTTLATQTVIWTAGVEGATPNLNPKPETTKRQEIIAQPTLQVQNLPNIYAVGDLAEVQKESMTGVAQEAIQQGQTAAKNILKQIKGQSPQEFNYYDKGTLAIIGRHAGVGRIGKFAFTGWLAWFLWLEVHWFYLPGIRNRFGVLFNWLKCYLFGEGTNRLILREQLPANLQSSNTHPASKTY
ncbi:MAG: NAD(P)/FAD-dependent oxidoreductase [Microcoleaceae cyanobacterium]